MVATVEDPSGSAVGEPRKSLIAEAMRFAVVKSALRSQPCLHQPVQRELDPRSMMAPLKCGRRSERRSISAASPCA